MQEYFATLDSQSVGPEIMKRIDDYYMHLETSGMLRTLRKSYSKYYGSSGNSSEILQTGVQGELSAMSVNHYRNLIQHLLTMTTSSRPALEARATNSDYRSQAQTILANGLLDFYLREKKLERFLKSAVEQALILFEGWVRAVWDTSGGEQYAVDPDSGLVIYTGDVRYSTHSLVDVIRDPHRENTDFNWLIVRTWRNRFDLAAKYPEMADKILAVAGRESLSRFDLSTRHSKQTDEVPVYEFYHDKTDALPNGRLVTLLDADTVFMDTPLPYEEIPLYRIASSDQIATPFGYSSAVDLLGIQDAIDTLYSTVLTNQKTFGVQNIMSPRGSGLSVTELVGGLNHIEYDKAMGPPSSLNLPQTPAEVFKFIDMLERTAETLSGVNSVARGNPEASLQSGAALALVQSMAIQFASGLQSSYAQLLEDVGTGTIKLLRDFSESPRVAFISGKANRPMLKEFKGSDLDQVTRFHVDVANPLSRTVAGRVELANTLLQSQMITHAEQYLQVISTGNLQPMVEGEQSELMLIRSENERLSEGQPVQALAVDSHVLHVTEHRTVLANPDSRMNPDLVNATLAHIQEHLELLRNTDPDLLALMGQQAIQPQQPPADMPTGAPQVLDATNPVTQQAAKVNMPAMPESPIQQ